MAKQAHQAQIEEAPVSTETSGSVREPSSAGAGVSGGRMKNEENRELRPNRVRGKHLAGARVRLATGDCFSVLGLLDELTGDPAGLFRRDGERKRQSDRRVSN
jgi:hypothetical protein